MQLPLTDYSGNAQQFVYNDKQKYLKDELEKYTILSKDKHFGDLYTSAIIILEIDVKSRLAMAAHCLREIVEKLPETINGGSLKNNSADDRNALIKLRDKWKTIVAQPSWQDLTWETKVIDSMLGTFLNDFDQNSKLSLMSPGPSRRDLFVQLIKHFNPSNQGQSAGFVAGMWDRWKDIDIYMKKVSHCAATTNEEFLEYMASFENLLFDIFKKPILDNMDEIDRIIQEGEAR